MFSFSLFAGDVSDEDLVILLSERVAKSLYYNWVETLKVGQDVYCYLLLIQI